MESAAFVPTFSKHLPELTACLRSCVPFCAVLFPDEDVRKYCENLKKKAEPPLQVPEVDSCVPRTPERSGITVDDDPEGEHLYELTVIYMHTHMLILCRNIL